MLILIIVLLIMVLWALGVIVTGLRAIRSDIQRLIDVQTGESSGDR